MTGVRSGWEGTYRRESGRMWRAMVAFGGDRDIASDAVAEAFAQAISARSEIRDPTAWVWKVAYRIAAAELRRRSAQQQFVDPGDAYEMAEPELGHLLDALATLTPSQRAAVLLHDYADRPTEELVETLGMKLPTIHVHLSQGRKRLREYLEDHDD